jgi:hypothetical protein
LRRLRARLLSFAPPPPATAPDPRFPDEDCSEGVIATPTRVSTLEQPLLQQTTALCGAHPSIWLGCSSRSGVVVLVLFYNHTFIIRLSAFSLYGLCIAHIHSLVFFVFFFFFFGSP